ncbi:hypothetical protein SAMN04487957_110152 [Halomonas shengliensis]|uniref:Uncharacterized protein n=1 Tax=Halomonas shengliensis TaxID=419597 RepID=A0A1H0LY98_9GAMM|nr:hypothetical protein [Halomonas shengliensis]SDO73105.1 hypothetical protein SAMN04487957_110152 [Halomonas shengliensis]
MSSSRLSRAIQRIAKSDPDLRGAIKATRNRGDQPGASGVGTSESERDRICCDGSVNENPNPGTETRDPDSGGQDASGGLDPDDPANLDEMGEGSLTGLHDCATGEPVCFEGSDWVPPDGWESPTEPPISDGYEEGYFWIYNNQVAYRGQTAFEAASKWCNDYGFCVSICGCSGGGCNYTYSLSDEDCTSVISVDKRECNTNNADICDQPPPLADSWPSDSCVNLAIKNGSIVGSKYDPENDGSYSKPRQEIPLCDQYGNSILIRADTDSTWKSIKALDGDIDPDTGYGYLYETATGRRIRQISPSEFRDDTV